MPNMNILVCAAACVSLPLPYMNHCTFPLFFPSTCSCFCFPYTVAIIIICMTMQSTRLYTSLGLTVAALCIPLAVSGLSDHGGTKTLVISLASASDGQIIPYIIPDAEHSNKGAATPIAASLLVQGTTGDISSTALTANEDSKTLEATDAPSSALLTPSDADAGSGEGNAAESSHQPAQSADAASSSGENSQSSTENAGSVDAAQSSSRDESSAPDSSSGDEASVSDVASAEPNSYTDDSGSESDSEDEASISNKKRRGSSSSSSSSTKKKSPASHLFPTSLSWMFPLCLGAVTANRRLLVPLQ
ncbi:hypothetical protein GQ54DRAFT_7884 [Martensiomyces pterosporus]|nr:hypothetical protein GQ54DRAFT_7884 [Martensiomyces pterosporus]